MILSRLPSNPSTRSGPSAKDCEEVIVAIAVEIVRDSIVVLRRGVIGKVEVRGSIGAIQAACGEQVRLSRASGDVELPCPALKGVCFRCGLECRVFVNAGYLH